VAAGAALLSKEDAALALVVLGLVIAWKQRHRIGLAIAAVAAGWFVLATKVIIPNANGVGPLYDQLFPGFGTNVFQIGWNMVIHPSRILDVATRHAQLTYYRKLILPVGLVALGAPELLLVGGPQLVINVVSAHPYTHDIRYHYSAAIVAAVFIAAVEACGRIGRAVALRWAVVALVGLSAVAANAAWSPSPIGHDYDSGIWAKPQARHAVVNRALRLVPHHAGVTATYYLVPHLTHRTHIYEFPNPFVVANWGIRGEHPPDPDSVDVLVLDTELNGTEDDLYRKLTASNAEFRIVFDEDGIVVAERRPTAGTGGSG